MYTINTIVVKKAINRSLRVDQSRKVIPTGAGTVITVGGYDCIAIGPRIQAGGYCNAVVWVGGGGGCSR